MSDKSSSETHQLRRIDREYDSHGEYVNGTNVQTYTCNNFRTGSEDPDWKQKVRDGVDATGGLTAQKMELIYSLSPKVLLVDKGPNGIWALDPLITEVSGRIAEPAIINWNVNDYTSILGSVDNRALVKLYQDIQARDTAASGGTFLGELRETIKMIRKPAEAFRKGLDAYMNDVKDIVRGKVRITRRFNKYKEISKTLSGLWLEYAFGWKPLVQDIADLASVFGRNSDMFARRSHARGHAYKEELISTLQNDITFSNTLVFNRPEKHIKSVRVIYRAGLESTPTAPFGSFERLTELAGFRWNQFVPTVWNLLPYSFLVDYFTNIGDVLECTAVDRRAIKWVNRTVIYRRYKYVETYVNQYESTKSRPQYRTVSGNGYGYALSSFSRVERASTGVRFPTLEFRMPAVDSAKWINIAALIVQGKVTSKGLAAL